MPVISNRICEQNARPLPTGNGRSQIVAAVYDRRIWHIEKTVGGHPPSHRYGAIGRPPLQPQALGLAPFETAAGEGPKLPVIAAQTLRRKAYQVSR
jgi:hypothetical protein